MLTSNPEEMFVVVLCVLHTLSNTLLLILTADEEMLTGQSKGHVDRAGALKVQSWTC